MKFRTKLWLGNGTVLGLMTIIAAFVYQSVNSLITTSEWVTYTYQVIEQGNILQKSLVDMETGECGFLITGREEFLTPYYEGKQQFNIIINNIKKLISNNAEQVERLEQVQSLADRWHSEVAEVAIAKRKLIVAEANNADDLQDFLSTGIGKRIMDDIQNLLNQLRDKIQMKDDKVAEILILSIAKDMIDQETGQRGFLITGKDEFLEPYHIGLTALDTHLRALEQHFAEDTENLEQVNTVKLLAAKWREKAVEPALSVRREMNQNNTRFREIVAPLEKGVGKRYMNEMQILLTQFIDIEKNLLLERQTHATHRANITIYTTLYGTFMALVIGLILIILLTRNIMRIVDQIIISSSAVSVAAEEMAQGNLNLSQRTEQQAASLEETAASMEEMTSTVQQNADNARQATHLAMNARERAQAGGEVVGMAVVAMTEINNSSKKVADIIGVIDEIAFQTNLLALNAAVEAARAGEQGRGFAVVAAEVRSLAQRSAAAAKEIKGLIKDSIIKVEEGTRLVNQSGLTLEEIVTAVKKASDMIVEIAAASEEQSTGIQQVNKVIMQLDDITQQNATLVEEAAVASTTMKEQTQSLQEQVTFFKTHDKYPTLTEPSQKPLPETEPSIREGLAKKPVVNTHHHKLPSESENEWKDF